MIQKYTTRLLTTNKKTTPVTFFSNKKLQYFTLPIDYKNVLITTNNPIITEFIINNHPHIIPHHHPLLVPTAIADHLHIDLVVLLNVYCDNELTNINWDLFFILASHTTPHKEYLQESWEIS